MKVLCVNAGSSSLKFQLYDMPEEIAIISGYVEKIGARDSFYTIKYNGEKTETKKAIKDHSAAVAVMLEELVNYGAVKNLEEIRSVGHRVVHGGEKYAKSVVIDDKMRTGLRYYRPSFSRRQSCLSIARSRLFRHLPQGMFPPFLNRGFTTDLTELTKFSQNTKIR